MSDSTLITFAILLRVFGALRDGWSGNRVTWLAWHVCGWLYRDLIIFVIVWHFLGAPFATWNAFQDWLMLASLNVVAHGAFYWLGGMTVKLFPNRKI